MGYANQYRNTPNLPVGTLILSAGLFMALGCGGRTTSDARRAGAVGVAAGGSERDAGSPASSNGGAAAGAAVADGGFTSGGGRGSSGGESSASGGVNSGGRSCD